MPSETQELTEREKEILQLLSEGLTYGEIGEKLRIKEETVEYYIQNALKKSGVKTIVRMVLLAYQVGLLDDPPDKPA